MLEPATNIDMRLEVDFDHIVHELKGALDFDNDGEGVTGSLRGPAAMHVLREVFNKVWAQIESLEIAISESCLTDHRTAFGVYFETILFLWYGVYVSALVNGIRRCLSVAEVEIVDFYLG